jgi:hypothetical protein
MKYNIAQAIRKTLFGEMLKEIAATIPIIKQITKRIKGTSAL